MTLNKALKQKNRIVGELNRLKTILVRENSRVTPSASTVNREEVLKGIMDATSALTEIKARIAKANVGIYDKIEKVSQLKALIEYVQTIPTTKGVVRSPNYNGGTTETHYDAFVTQEMVDSMVRNSQTEIETLQDEIDEYNATTKI